MIPGSVTLCQTTFIVSFFSVLYMFLCKCARCLSSISLCNTFLFNWAIVYVSYLLLKKSLSLSSGNVGLPEGMASGRNHSCVSHYKNHFPVSSLRTLAYTCTHDWSLLESSSGSWLISVSFWAVVSVCHCTSIRFCFYGFIVLQEPA